MKNERVEMVVHPKHYNEHPSGIECIEVVRHFGFDVGNAIKYLWRCGLKPEDGISAQEKEIEDCEKAVFYIQDHIAELKRNINKQLDNGEREKE